MAMVIDNITAWYFLTRGGESINVLNPDSENANLKNRLINALFGFYLLQYTIVVIARQYTSHNNDLTYAITYIDIGWFGLLSILYLAGFISALMLETPRNKYLIKSFAILLTTIITSLGGSLSIWATYLHQYSYHLFINNTCDSRLLSCCPGFTTRRLCHAGGHVYLYRRCYTIQFIDERCDIELNCLCRKFR